MLKIYKLLDNFLYFRAKRMEFKMQERIQNNIDLWTAYSRSRIIVMHLEISYTLTISFKYNSNEFFNKENMMTTFF